MGVSRLAVEDPVHTQPGQPPDSSVLHVQRLSLSLSWHQEQPAAPLHVEVTDKAAQRSLAPRGSLLKLSQKQ